MVELVAQLVRGLLDEAAAQQQVERRVAVGHEARPLDVFAVRTDERVTHRRRPPVRPVGEIVEAPAVEAASLDDRAGRDGGGVVVGAEHAGDVDERRTLDTPLADRSGRLTLEVDEHVPVAGDQDLAEVEVTVHPLSLAGVGDVDEARQCAGQRRMVGEHRGGHGIDDRIETTSGLPERGHRTRHLGANALRQRSTVVTAEPLGSEGLAGSGGQRQVEFGGPGSESGGVGGCHAEQVGASHGVGTLLARSDGAVEEPSQFVGGRCPGVVVVGHELGDDGDGAGLGVRPVPGDVASQLQRSDHGWRVREGGLVGEEPADLQFGVRAVLDAADQLDHRGVAEERRAVRLLPTRPAGGSAVGERGAQGAPGGAAQLDTIALDPALRRGAGQVGDTHRGRHGVDQHTSVGKFGDDGSWRGSVGRHHGHVVAVRRTVAVSDVDDEERGRPVR